MNIKGKLKEENIQLFIKLFNKDFDTKIKSQNNKLLINLYENFINQFSSESYLSKEKMAKLVEVEDKIKLSYNEEQRKLFDEWNGIQENFFCDMQQQVFVYGYCMCKQLEIESNMKITDNN